MPRLHLAVAACFLALSPLAMIAQLGDTVAGRVVSAIDGHPLPHAVVTLTNRKRPQDVVTATADDDGRYSFRSVGPGKYRLTGAAARYITAAYLDHGTFGTAIVTGAGLATDALELRLIPVASISGTVLDENGEPVPHANVALYRQNLTGPQRILRNRNVQTEDDGSYEFLNLPRGRYFVSATGTPWYAVHPPASREGANEPYRVAVDPALDAAYPTIFYSGTLDAESASPLTVNGGEQLTANFLMRPQHAVTLSFKLPTNQRGNAFPQLTRSVFGIEEPVNGQMESSNGTIRMAGMAVGRYNLQESTTGGMGFPSKTVDLTAASPNSIEIPQNPDLATLIVTPHLANGAALPAQHRLTLRSATFEREVSASVGKEGTATFANIPPSDYKLLAIVENHSTRILDLTINNQHIADKQLHITSSGNIPIDVTFTSASAEIDGFARIDGKPTPGVMVTLVPAGSDTSEELFRRDQSDLDGSFAFTNVVPGNYILIAIDDGWGLNWTDIPTLAPYLLHGLPITVPATSSNPIHLTDPVATQPRR